MITRDEIAKIYLAVYPDLENYYAIITSTELIIPKFDEELWPKIKEFSVAGIPHIKNIRDCEKRVWKVWGNIQWDRGMRAKQLPEEERKTWTIGWLFGFKMPFETEHSIITTYSDKGIINIDPLTDSIEKPDVNKFNAILLVM